MYTTILYAYKKRVNVFKNRNKKIKFTTKKTAV